MSSLLAAICEVEMMILLCTAIVLLTGFLAVLVFRGSKEIDEQNRKIYVSDEE